MMFARYPHLLDIAPIMIFGLGAVFAASAFALGAYPSSPQTWHLFLTLAPVVREPVHLAIDGMGFGYGGALMLFALLAAAGCLLAGRRGLPRTRFIYSHGALLVLLFAMGQSRVFQAGNEGLSVGSVTVLNWVPNFSQFPGFGLMLTGMVFLSCAACHALIIRRALRQRAIRREIDTRLGEGLRHFG